MKIKTFKFLMSNIASLNMLRKTNGATVELDNYDIKANIYTPVATEAEIDKKINKFLKDKTVINILINDYTISRHNNARCDTIERTYTIMYND